MSLPALDGTALDGAALDGPAFTHDGPGTAEASWLAWPGLRDLPAAGASSVTHLLLVAAHPDDETLGAGGLLATAAAAGARVDVVVATDGEGSHPASTTHTGAELAGVRADEVERAVHLLAPQAALHLLHLGDGALTEHVDALTAHLRTLVGPGSLVVAPWAGDRHPDHEAAAHAAAGAVEGSGARLWNYPVWAWHWARPGGPEVPWTSAVRLDLAPDVLQGKLTALAEHTSQVAPLSPAAGDEVLLPASVLAHFTRGFEVFLTDGPAGRDSLDAAFFEEFYAGNGDDPWGFEDRWYEQRKRDLTLAVLPRRRFRRGLEVGCSAGVATVGLAERCEELLALDASPSALALAAERLRGSGSRVELREGVVPRDWPAGTFDLVVMAEVAYYCGPEDLQQLAAAAVAALAPDGVLVACHWRHLVEGYPSTGDEVHRVLRAQPGVQVLAHHEEEDFLLDVLVPAPAVSVARAEGLTP
ncbi:PIG-L family deacetylase [Kineococcus rubinsiae]|uniref:PIG-L family deacetylase n=1 Tax=Kineococcus rubinsiae TaxID=2609562 RepID=UPI0014309447|nr:PIG-L family deacetylase [Kineococcus rubinsiae]NIZ92062.1 methyltransferase domain-containing protein [Kineococcus rubinsiae]